MKKILIHSADTNKNGVDLQDMTIIACNDGYISISNDDVIHHNNISALAEILMEFIKGYLK